MQLHLLIVVLLPLQRPVVIVVVYLTVKKNLHVLHNIPINETYPLDK